MRPGSLTWGGLVDYQLWKPGCQNNPGKGCRYITGQDERMPLYPGIITAGHDETEDAARYHSPGREDAAISQARPRLRMPLYHHHRPGKAGCYTHSDRPGRLVMLYHRPCRENVLYHRPGMTKSQAQTSSTGLRHPSFNGKEGAGKRCSEWVGTGHIM